MARHGVAIRWVPPDLFMRESYYATAAERFRYRFRSDVVLLLDADTLVVGPLDELVEETYRTGALGGVIAHVAPVDQPARWRELHEACGIEQWDARYEHTGWGYLFNDESLRYCPSYFNLGVLCGTPDSMNRIGEVIYALMERIDGVVHTHFRVQLAVSLAITKLQLPHRAWPMRYNFPNDPLLEALHAAELPHVRVVHLLRDHQFYKTDLFATLDRVEAMLNRRDLRVINALAQQTLAAVHADVKREQAEAANFARPPSGGPEA